MGLSQSRRWKAPAPNIFSSPTHSCYYWHVYSCKHRSLVTQATQNRPGSSATPTSSTPSYKKASPCVGLSNNKPPPSCLESSNSPLTSLLPVWPVGSYQPGQCSCRGLNPDTPRRTHPAIQPLAAPDKGYVTPSSRQLAKLRPGGSQELGHRDEELQGSQCDLNGA